ncbi:MAG: OmpA family protein [Chitinophagales bacterium]
MKFNALVFGLIAVILTFSSCVSKKKYNSLLSEKESLEMRMKTTPKTPNKDEQLKGELQRKDAELDAIRAKIKESNDKIQKLKAAIEQAFADSQNPDIQIQEKNGKLYVILPNQILYKSGSADLDAKGIEMIETIAAIFIKNQGLDIDVEGHTDNVPISTKKYADNWDLSVARAVNVVRKLTDSKVNPARLSAVGNGEFYPIIDNSTPENRQQNRRTEFVITPKITGLYQLLNDL